jgi:hypothetical protein
MKFGRAPATNNSFITYLPHDLSPIRHPPAGQVLYDTSAPEYIAINLRESLSLQKQ